MVVRIGSQGPWFPVGDFPALSRNKMALSNVAMKVFLFIVIAGSMSNTTRNNQQRGNKTSTLQMQLFQNSDKKLLSNAIALHQMTYTPTIRRRRKEREIRRLLGKSSHLNETRSHSLALSFFILILSGDIEQNPGPGFSSHVVCAKSL